MVDMRLFDYGHLPDHLKSISQAFQEVANGMTNRFDDADLNVISEREAGLRKLLEAKDCFVRCAVLEAKGKEPNE